MTETTTPPAASTEADVSTLCRQILTMVPYPRRRESFLYGMFEPPQERLSLVPRGDKWVAVTPTISGDAMPTQIEALRSLAGRLAASWRGDSVNAIDHAQALEVIAAGGSIEATKESGQ